MLKSVDSDRIRCQRNRERRVGRAPRRAGTQAAHHAQPADVGTIEQRPPAVEARLHHERHPHVGRPAHRFPEETGRRHADDRDVLPLDDQARADDRRIAAKSPLPEGVAQHGHSGVAGRLVVLWSEGPAHQRPHAQHRKKLTGNELHPGLFGPADGPGSADVQAREAVLRREHAREGIHLVADPLEQRIGEILFLSARCDDVEDDELRGVLDRESREQDRVDEGEDGRVGADAQREREHRDRGEARRCAQQAPRVAQVL